MPTPSARRRQRRWILIALTVLSVSIWYTNVNQTLNTRKGCQRGTTSYTVNAQNWRTAQQARHDAYAQDHKAFDLFAETRYSRNAAILERLANTDCGNAYPLPFPLHL